MILKAAGLRDRRRARSERHDGRGDPQDLRPPRDDDQSHARGDARAGDDTLFTLEVNPAIYVVLAANEAEKASPIRLVGLGAEGAAVTWPRRHRRGDRRSGEGRPARARRLRPREPGSRLMFLGRVVGEVWATKKVGDLSGLRLLVVEALDERRDPSAPKVMPVVAADPLGAALGEHVVVAFGKAARVAARRGRRLRLRSGDRRHRRRLRHPERAAGMARRCDAARFGASALLGCATRGASAPARAARPAQPALRAARGRMAPMLIGTVIGNVWATKKDPTLVGLRFLVIRPFTLDGETAETIVAVDPLGAGIGERVLVVFGRAARHCDRSQSRHRIPDRRVGDHRQDGARGRTRRRAARPEDEHDRARA